MILQHDLPLPKNSMGGPLFNLQGECIGLNIARVDRVTIYAPSSQVLETLSEVPRKMNQGVKRRTLTAETQAQP